MNKKLFHLSALVFLLFVFAAKSLPCHAQSLAELPACFNDPIKIEKINKILRANSKNTSRYDGYREVLSSAPDTELFARLAYSETLAANCPNLNDEISSRIVNVIGNRVLLRKGDVRSVVFQNAQFASSLHIYKNSRYLDFLCPKDLELWSFLTAQIKTFLKNKNGALSADTVHYFLYKHDPRWTKEPWNLKEDSADASEKLRECLRTFRNPHWK